MSSRVWRGLCAGLQIGLEEYQLNPIDELLVPRDIDKRWMRLKKVLSTFFLELGGEEEEVAWTLGFPFKFKSRDTHPPPAHMISLDLPPPL